MKTHPTGTRRFLAVGSALLLAAAATIFLAARPVAACGPTHGGGGGHWGGGQGGWCCEAGLTEWLADDNDWSVDENWDNGVPTFRRIARIDNWGTANVLAPAAFADELQLGYADLSGGTVVIHPGAALATCGDQLVGIAADGTILQIGGENRLFCGELLLGIADTASGTYAMDDGILYAQGQTIGVAGIGSFYQAAGCNTAAAGLTIAAEATSFGSYAMDGGALSVSRDEIIGDQGIGAFYQGGGIHAVWWGGVTLADGLDSQGAYTLAGGELWVCGPVTAGRQGLASVEVLDGRMLIAGSFLLGEAADATGTVTLGGGRLDVAGCEVIAADGTAIFAQTGGVHTVRQSMAVGGAADSFAMVSILGGELLARNLCIGTRGGMAMFDIADADAAITVEDALVFGPDAYLTAACGSTIVMAGGSVINLATDEYALAGMDALAVVFDGRGRCWGWSSYEVAGTDLGPDAAGFLGNFALDALIVGGDAPARVVLRDCIDNGNRSPDAPEALYVHNLIVAPGSVLHLGGLNLYCDGALDIQGDVVGGHVTPIP